MTLEIVIPLVGLALGFLGSVIGVSVALGRVLERQKNQEHAMKETKAQISQDITGIAIRFQHEKDIAVEQRRIDMADLEKRFYEHRDNNDEQHTLFQESRDDITRLTIIVQGLEKTVSSMQSDLKDFMNEMRAKK